MIAIFDLDRTVTRYGTFSPWLLGFIRHRPWRILTLPIILVAALGHKLGLLSRKQLKQVMLTCVAAGLDRALIETVNDEFVAAWVPNRCRPGALRAIAAHKANGDRIVLATASNDVHAIPIARALGIDFVVATRAETGAQGQLTGRILGPNCYGVDKLDLVRAALGGNGEPTVAYTDHHSDWPLIEWATQAVAINPNKKLRQLASAKGLQILDWDE